MSKKRSLFRDGYSISDALYDAKRSEVTQEAIASVIFLVVGLIIIIVSFVKYFGITGAAQEPSDNVNANAWLIFAAVGAVIGIIGLINAVKSLTSFSGITSSIKGMMTKASPFQTRPINRGVATMNQSQSMSEAPNKGMAENDKAVGYKGIMKKLSKSAESNSKAAKTYDRYNNQQPKQTPKKNPSPQSQPPSMVQKFDYGIDELNKKTFADKFLEENKKDPFEEYKKELGIKDAPKKEKESKPQFIISNRAPSTNLTYGMTQEQSVQQVQSSQQARPVQQVQSPQQTAPVQQVQSPQQTAPVQQVQSPQQARPVQQVQSTQQVRPVQPVQSSDNSVKTLGQHPSTMRNGNNTASEQVRSTQQISLTKQENVSSDKESLPQYTIPTVRTEDDDFFLSFNTHTQASVTQQMVSTEKKSTSSKVKKESNSSDEEKFFLNYQSSDNNDTYDLGLFEDNVTSERKSNNTKASEKISNSDQNYANLKNIDLRYGFEKGAESNTPVINKTATTATVTEPTLSYNIGNPIKSLDEVMETAHLNIKPLENIKPKQNVQTNNIITNSSVKSDAKSTAKVVEKNNTSSVKKTVSQTVVNNNAEVKSDTEKKITGRIGTQSEKYNFDAFAERKSKETPATKVPENTNDKKDKLDASSVLSGIVSSVLTKFNLFKEKYANKKQDVLPSVQPSEPKKSTNREICTNGTKSQRKFVDASEYDEWSCPTCGKVNQEYVGVCCCGTRKPRVK